MVRLMIKQQRIAMTDTDGILTNVEAFLSQQYDERHMQIVPVVRDPIRERDILFALTVLGLSALAGGMAAELCGWFK